MFPPPVFSVSRVTAECEGADVPDDNSSLALTNGNYVCVRLELFQARWVLLGPLTKRQMYRLNRPVFFLYPFVFLRCTVPSGGGVFASVDDLRAHHRPVLHRRVLHRSYP